jgi:hypothetical protein
MKDKVSHCYKITVRSMQFYILVRKNLVYFLDQYSFSISQFNYREHVIQLLYIEIFRFDLLQNILPSDVNHKGYAVLGVGLGCSNGVIAGSNPIRSPCVCLSASYCVALSFVDRGVATGWATSKEC